MYNYNTENFKQIGGCLIDPAMESGRTGPNWKYRALNIMLHDDVIEKVMNNDVHVDCYKAAFDMVILFSCIVYGEMVCNVVSWKWHSLASTALCAGKTLTWMCKAPTTADVELRNVNYAEMLLF